MKRKKLIIGLLVLIGLAICLWAMPYERVRYTCLQCRLNKTVKSYCWMRFTSHEENDCSRWYMREHPSHQHDWKWSGCDYGREFFARYISCGDGHLVFTVPEDLQLYVLEHGSQKEIDEFFRLLESEGADNYEKVHQLISDVLTRELE